MHLIHDALSNYGYLAAFLLVFSGAAYLPVPNSLVVVIAGALMTHGFFQFPILLPLLVTAIVLGDLAGYGLARRFTSQAFWDRQTERFWSLARLEAWLHRRPLATVIVSRFIPFANGGVNSLAGMCRLPPARFAVADLVGNIGFIAAHLLLGVVFGRV